MTAWEELTRYSRLGVGTAWEHITNQDGGGTKTVLVVNADGADLASLPLGMSMILATLYGNFETRALACDLTEAALSGTVSLTVLDADLARVDLIAGAVDAPTEGVIYGD